MTHGGSRAGTRPAARGRAVVLRIEPPSFVRCLAPDGLPSLVQYGWAGCAGGENEGGPFPWPGTAGARMAVARCATAIFLARPLGGLARRRALRCASLSLRLRPRAGPPPRPPATPEAGPPSSQLGPARPPCQSLRLVARRPRSRRTSWTWVGLSAAAVAPAMPSRPPLLFRALVGHAFRSREPDSPPRSPHGAPVSG